MTKRTALGALAFFLSLPLLAEAQGRTVTIQVSDSSGNPVPYAAVSGGTSQTITDRTGEARMPRVQPGTVRLRVRRIGFTPEFVTVMGDRDTTIHVVMAPIATMLEAQVVRARVSSPLERRGFYDRMRDRERGLITGYFILPEDIEQRKPTRMTQMLYEVPSLRMSNVPGIGAIPQGPDGCPMTFYVDGARVETYMSEIGRSVTRIDPRRTPGSSRPGLPAMDELVGATNLAAIEVYPRGNRAPAMYQLLNGTCGIIAVWTKV